MSNSQIQKKMKKELEEASDHFKKAGKIEQDIGDLYSYSRTLNHLARLARVQSNLDEAEKFLEESLHAPAPCDLPLGGCAD